MKAKALLAVCVASIVVAAMILGRELREGRRQAGSDSRAAVHAAPAEVACPVTGKAVDTNICTIREGKCIYFCSETCASEFAKEPEKYIEKLKEQGVELQRASSCSHLDM